TTDDQVYSLASSGYTNGLTASLRITDGPLQPGTYRFTASTALTDRAGNALPAAFVRDFGVAGVPYFTLENRSNDTPATATSLSTAPTSAFDGSFTVAGTSGVGINPYAVASGDFNKDGHLDLVTANYGSGSVSVLLGNGGGGFAPAVSYATG